MAIAALTFREVLSQRCFVGRYADSRARMYVAFAIKTTRSSRRSLARGHRHVLCAQRGGLVRSSRRRSFSRSAGRRSRPRSRRRRSGRRLSRSAGRGLGDHECWREEFRARVRQEAGGEPHVSGLRVHGAGAGVILPWYCHDLAMFVYHALAMLLPCSCHALAMLLPCSCHAIATLSPYCCHGIALRCG